MTEAAISGLSIDEAAVRAGVEADYVGSLIELGILAHANGRLTRGDVRRIGLIRSLEDAGLPLDGMAEGFARGLLSVDFVDRPEYDKFAELSQETFAAAAARTGVPLELLLVVREVTGFGAALPDSLVREDEQRVIPFIELQVQLGFEAAAIERLLRAMGDNLRRIAEAEAEWWRTQVTGPRIDAGQTADDVGQPTGAEVLPSAAMDALLGIYTALQAQTWTSNILSAFQSLLASGGVHQSPDRPPAICFLDITGYTRLTEERGDRAAAELAEILARLVKRASAKHGGQPVKWLGDGVMCWFRDPGPAVLAALEMVDGVRGAGLPPAHVGIHTGPVVMQGGDYFGQTVNMAARIADFARPGEVLVSGAIVAATPSVADVAFAPLGAVELKGVAGASELFAARRGS